MKISVAALGLFMMGTVLGVAITGTPLQAQISFDKVGGEGEKAKIDPKDLRGPIPDVVEKRKYRAGMIFEASSGSPCSGIVGTVPVPMEFPEQQVRVIEENFPNAARIDYRNLKEGGARQLVLKMRNLRAGQKIEASVLMEVTRTRMKPPITTACYSIPKKVPREFKYYMKNSPYIEADSRKVKEWAKAAIADRENDWDKVQALFEYVRTKVTYKEEMKQGTMRGALAAIKNGAGDCEDMCALFIAMCRCMDIPARLVRVPGHCYAEFYLIDEKGEGHWFPAQVAGTEPMGGLQDTRIILQKGDCFRLPESPREETLYVKELFSGSVKEGGRDPRYQFIQEDLSNTQQ